MNPSTAKTIRLYSSAIIPVPVKSSLPWMPHRLARWLKDQWRQMPARERAELRKVMERGDPLPPELDRRATERGFKLHWPIRPKERRARHRRAGKPKSPWLQRYFGKGQ